MKETPGRDAPVWIFAVSSAFFRGRKNPVLTGESINVKIICPAVAYYARELFLIEDLLFICHWKRVFLFNII